jgi:phosphate transport system substrate-binding protein
VARDHHSLGVVSLAAQRSARVVSLETSCGLRIGPSALSVKAGEYPLALPLYLYAATPPKEAAARNLLRFVTSPAAAEAIDGAGFMSLAPAMVGLEGQAERLAHATNAEREAFDLGHMRTMLADLKGWQRLSATIRLAGGAREADMRTKAEAERLAQLLQRSELKGRRVLLAGFTDVDGGKFQANLAQSAKRAAVVRSLVVAAGGAALDARRILAKGYGPLAPIACNDTAEGRALNRRVEVWVEGKGGRP